MPDHNPFVTCPYNKSHRVLRSRIQRHLVKCEKIYPKLAICPYDYTHRFPPSELNTHIAFDCTSKVLTIISKEDKLSKVVWNHPKPNRAHSFTRYDPDYDCWD